jgi:hypothetical protein
LYYNEEVYVESGSQTASEILSPRKEDETNHHELTMESLKREEFYMFSVTAMSFVFTVIFKNKK